MGMNNIYYRFQYTMGNGSAYADFPVRLRMQIIGQPGVDCIDFELWCLAASVITGSEDCVRSHENMVRERGGTAEQVQDAVRIAAVIHAVALTLDSAPRCRLGHDGAAAHGGEAAEHHVGGKRRGTGDCCDGDSQGLSIRSASSAASAIAAACELEHQGQHHRSPSLQRPSRVPGRR
jgi:AhpD family alkylhydroperoxidase